MKKVINAGLALTISFLFVGSVNAQSANTNAIANTQTASDAGAMAQTGAITFEASEPLHSQRVHTTPPVYTAPSMFGYSSNNCGASDTVSVGFTGFGIGGSVAGESVRCNTRQDVATAWNLGLKQVALLRFACFGEPENRMAYEAAGYTCPSSGTAKGIEGAPVQGKFLVATSIARTMHGTINQDGTITYK